MKIGAREYWGTKLSSDLRDEEVPAGKFREITFPCGSVVAPLRWALNGSWVRIVEVACEGWKPSDPYFARVGAAWSEAAVASRRAKAMRSFKIFFMRMVSLVMGPPDSLIRRRLMFGYKKRGEFIIPLS